MWVSLGSVAPGTEWSFLPVRLSSRLIRLSFFGDEPYLKKFQPRAYLRVRVIGEGTQQRWVTLWPRNGTEELIEISPIPINSNFLDLRKRKDPYSENATWSVAIAEFQSERYQINYDPAPLTVGEEPLTVGDSPLII